MREKISGEEKPVNAGRHLEQKFFIVWGV